MTDCNQCGACCRVIAIPVRIMTKDCLAYMRTRGIEIDGKFLVVPQVCQYLSTSNQCMIHESDKRPNVCRKFKGQAHIRNFDIFIPQECVYR